MIRNRKGMSCAEFSGRMAEMVAAGVDLFAHPHVRKCRLHRALLKDLEAIADAARNLFPDVDPSENLWNQIESRMADDISACLVSDPWPGCRVIVTAHAIEEYNPQASPPTPGSSPESAFGLTILGDHRTFAPRGERK